MNKLSLIFRGQLDQNQLDIKDIKAIWEIIKEGVNLERIETR
jgi:hypothetical protein